jgi:DNA-binding winged helix-turn-helix (wHTH) protein
VLVALLRRAGRLLTKRELLDLVWPASFVAEGILAVHISTLRKALGDVRGERRYIETVAGLGYRFIGALAEPDAQLAEYRSPCFRRGPSVSRSFRAETVPLA